MLKNAHKRSLKQWKAEQQTLSEVEFEWLRQVGTPPMRSGRRGVDAARDWISGDF